MISAIWRFRHFIMAAIIGELRVRFAASSVGALWFVLNPLAMATIYALVLSSVLKVRMGDVDNSAAFAIYLMAGIASWGLFQEIASRCLSIFVDYGNTMKKIAFPRIALPVIVLGGALLNHVLLLAATTVVFLFFGHFPSAVWVLLPLATLMTAGLAFGLGILLGVFNVFARDIGHVMSVVFQILFWMTPIVYRLDALPPPMQFVVGLNPMTPLVGFYQDVLLFGQMPSFQRLIYPAIVAASLLTLSLMVFRRASSELVDAL